jgi:hypothetical protein
MTRPRGVIGYEWGGLILRFIGCFVMKLQTPILFHYGMNLHACSIRYWFTVEGRAISVELWLGNSISIVIITMVDQCNILQLSWSTDMPSQVPRKSVDMT